MRDVKLENGDIAVDSSGRTVVLNGIDAKFQQAVICISAKLGGFVYDRSLGSEISECKDSVSVQKVQLLANEALASMSDTFAKVSDIGKEIKLKITIDGETREVNINGYI